MAALTGARLAREETIKSRMLVLAGGEKAFRGGAAAIDTSTHTVKRMAAGNANLVAIGQFEADVDNSGSTGTTYVQVTLAREIQCHWYDNDTGANAITAAGDLYGTAYQLDDHTVTHASSGNASAGRVWDVDSLRGVLVQHTGL